MILPLWQKVKRMFVAARGLSRLAASRGCSLLGAQASHCGGFACGVGSRAWAQQLRLLGGSRAQALWLWCTGWFCSVESSQTRELILVPSIGRQIPIHCTTRDVLLPI